MEKSNVPNDAVKNVFKNGKAFARAILPDLREFVADPQNQEIIEKWKRDNQSKR